MNASVATPSAETERTPPVERHDGRERAPRTEANISNTERWVSVAAGSALAAYGLTQHSWRRIAMAAAGAGLLGRGITRRCPVYRAIGVDTAHPARGRNLITAIIPARPIEVERSVTISRPREEVYRFWRDFTNLPRVMQHLESVTVLDDRRSHWAAKAPVGRPVEWDAEIVDDVPNERIAWRSVRDSGLDTSGWVRFADAPGGRGTTVLAQFRYGAPAGKLGVAVATLLGENPEQQVREDLRHLKQVLEAGEIPTTEGQPTGPRAMRRRAS
ncbi:MAG: DUF2892 domain-containing protein [Gemmatimonadaceae bacterium]|nr:DUF2892 domain-containing protein [Gemmatimonadaceae bacterium]